MRHYHSHISQLEARIGSAQTPEQMAARQRVTEGRMQPGSETEPVVKTLSSAPEKRSSETEPGKKWGKKDRVRIPNRQENQQIITEYGYRTITYVISHTV